ncbi:ERV/ALR sulfhydryl oxidase domain-containing protein [Powellomyces hirtus]|nr:ERV/ALR sulfhydryl oxidase domain-containing protein [Powellomyces hirtus]
MSSTSLSSKASSPSSSPSSSPYQPFPCPPDSSTLGSSTWTFLHTMAAYYPETPSPAEQLSMRNFISALTRFYPCGYCADHLTTEVIRNPPTVQNNRALSTWFCEVHNEVNQRQGKPKFDCSKVFERWRDGAPGNDCFPDLAEA